MILLDLLRIRIDIMNDKLKPNQKKKKDMLTPNQEKRVIENFIECIMDDLDKSDLGSNFLF